MNVKVKVSAASMRQAFHPCTPEFITNTCQARCCRSSVDPSGIAVYVSATEAVHLRARGAQVEDGGRVVPVNRRCPFQEPSPSHLCSLHGSTDKPFGCWASPFTLNARNTLIVRNRYRMLPCFKAEGAQPAYLAHWRSLAVLFGPQQAAELSDYLNDGGGDTYAWMPQWAVDYLHAKNATSKRRP